MCTCLCKCPPSGPMLSQSDLNWMDRVKNGEKWAQTGSTHAGDHQRLCSVPLLSLRGHIQDEKGRKS